MSVTSGTSNKNRLKMGAGFVGGGPSPILKPRNMTTSGYSGSPRYSADSMFSIYTGAKKALEEIDEEDEEMKEVEKTLVAEAKLRKIFKKQLKIHEVVLQEAAQLIRLVPAAVTAYNVYNSIDEEDEQNEEQDIEEMSTVAGSLGGGGGYTGPLAGSKHDLEKMRKVGFGG